MNQDTGAIANFEELQDAIGADFRVPLEDEEAKILQKLSRLERLQWLSEQPADRILPPSTEPTGKPNANRHRAVSQR